ncbi:hypothetical protein EZJ19_07775 [Parasulfuritortus cantonensis]|uniref:Uncharacterized protein n=1 Tax=Parasulfuritortus cantonensis TaxID=2528202 RepID=A0A4R1BDX7_9PROT|nr:hypothetical protein [Parasulfuritortus cantonensis]TCJ15198.1 hypothetical protein EZJ19_07775 [Parasulfuritortus cantonensis]
MLSLVQEQSQLNAMVMDLVQESQASHCLAVGCFDRFRVTAVCRINGVRVQLFESGQLVDVVWSAVPKTGA